MNPTAWFQYRHVDGSIKLVARWYFPASTRVEVNDGTGWSEARLLLEITEDPSWEASSEPVADRWIFAARSRRRRAMMTRTPDAID